jgi:hypothetical protein
LAIKSLKSLKMQETYLNKHATHQLVVLRLCERVPALIVVDVAAVAVVLLVALATTQLTVKKGKNLKKPENRAFSRFRA